MKQKFTQGIYRDVTALLPSLHQFTDTELFRYALATSTGIERQTYTTNGGTRHTIRTGHDHRSMVVLERCGKFQVLRYLQYYHRYHVPKPNLNIFEGEVQQIWIDTQTGDTITRTKNIRPFSTYSEQHFSLYSPLRYKLSNPIFSIDCGCTSILSLHPTLRQHGLHGRDMYGMSTCHVVRSLLTESKFESMWKRGQQKILAAMSRHYMSDAQADAILSASRIAYRSHYRVTDPSLWLDMVITLQRLGKDIHSPHYICPADLTEAHNRWNRLYERKSAEDRNRSETEKARRLNAEYIKRVGKYLGIHITSNAMDIRVCPSVPAMLEEGIAMHHCVYRMGYYRREKNCLILLVRDKNGGRIATTELNTITWTIVQTRGKCNMIPQLNGRDCLNTINTLIMDNISLFREAGRGTQAQAA